MDSCPEKAERSLSLRHYMKLIVRTGVGAGQGLLSYMQIHRPGIEVETGGGVFV